MGRIVDITTKEEYSISLREGFWHILHHSKPYFDRWEQKYSEIISTQKAYKIKVRQYECIRFKEKLQQYNRKEKIFRIKDFFPDTWKHLDMDDYVRIVKANINKSTLFKERRPITSIILYALPLTNMDVFRYLHKNNLKRGKECLASNKS